MKLFKAALLLIILSMNAALAQQSNGKLQSLLSAEHYFSSLVRTKGLRAAFLKVSDEGTLIFRPEPVKALAFFEKSKENPMYNLSWEPVFARIAKSGDWAFSTGPFQVKSNDQQNYSRYGQYVSVWKVNDKGIWKLALDLGIDHPKPSIYPSLDFREPKNSVYFRQPSVKRLQQREDVVLISDRLFSTTLFNKGSVAYREFLSDQARLLFPGHEPIIGKTKIMEFWEQNTYQLNCLPIEADRSASGDWAFTRGTATLSLKNESQVFNYVRIWELQQGYNWNLVLEIFTPLAN